MRIRSSRDGKPDRRRALVVAFGAVTRGRVCRSEEWVGVILLVIGFLQRKKGSGSGVWIMIAGALVLAYDLFASYPGGG
jgi:hypothetical protein